MYCSNRCKRERRSSNKASRAKDATAAAAAATVIANTSKRKGGEVSDGNRADGSGQEEADDLDDIELTSMSQDDPGILVDINISENLRPSLAFELDPQTTEANDDVSVFECGQEDAEIALAQSLRETRNAHTKIVKARQRSRRAASLEDRIAAKRKPCDICNRSVDLLVRCTCDRSKKWKMLCGRCWKDASGGVPDGDVDHPYYRYGGLWKNRLAKVTTPKFSRACISN